MANTAVLVYQGHNLLRYLITGDEAGGAFTIENDGGASPDLETDSLAGPIKQIALANDTGIGTVAAGNLTQAQARALLLADSNAADVGNNLVPRTRLQVTSRVGAAPSVDANVSAGAAIIEGVIAADAVAYLDIIAVGPAYP